MAWYNVISMKEKDFQREFGHWIADNKPARTAIFELKISKGPSIRFDAVREIQKEKLTEATEDGTYHKINDMPVTFGGDKMRFTNPKPFDCFFIRTSQAFVVVWFYVRGQRKGQRKMIWVKIADWLNLEKQWPRKSIREKDLEKVGQIYYF